MGIVTSIAATRKQVTLDAIHLYPSQGGKLPAVNITVTNRDDLLKAPRPASEWKPRLKARDWVRVAFDNDDISGQVWQYRTSGLRVQRPAGRHYVRRHGGGVTPHPYVRRAARELTRACKLAAAGGRVQGMHAQCDALHIGPIEV